MGGSGGGDRTKREKEEGGGQKEESGKGRPSATLEPVRTTCAEIHRVHTVGTRVRSTGCFLCKSRMEILEIRRVRSRQRSELGPRDSVSPEYGNS